MSKDFVMQAGGEGLILLRTCWKWKLKIPIHLLRHYGIFPVRQKQYQRTNKKIKILSTFM